MLFYVGYFCCWKILSGLLLHFYSVFNQTVGVCPLGGVGPGWIWGGVLRGILAASLLCPGPHTGGVLLRKLRAFLLNFGVSGPGR